MTSRQTNEFNLVQPTDPGLNMDALATPLSTRAMEYDESGYKE